MADGVFLPTGMSALFGRLGWLAVLWCVGSATIRAQISESIVGVGTGNYSGFVIDADAFDPAVAPGRSVLDTTAELIVTYDAGPLPIADTYTVTWSLADASGVVTPVASDQGAVPSLSETVDTQKPRVGHIVRRPLGVALHPATPLDPQKIYHVTETVTRV